MVDSFFDLKTFLNVKISGLIDVKNSFNNKSKNSKSKKSISH